MNKAQRLQVRVVLAGTAYAIITSLVNPAVYAAAGLDTKRALSAAKANEYHHDKIRQGAAKTMTFLDETGLVGGPSKLVLRKAHLI